jgi:hypothetical protein
MVLILDNLSILYIIICVCVCLNFSLLFYCNTLLMTIFKKKVPIVEPWNIVPKLKIAFQHGDTFEN